MVSVPHVDYTRWGLTVAPLNIEAGEDIRWLPRQPTDGMGLPADDFWLLDDDRVLFTVFEPAGRFAGGAELTGASDTRRNLAVSCSVTAVVDIDAAIGYVVAHGDLVERARLSWLRTKATPAQRILDRIETGQTPAGGWPATGAVAVPSVDATCFRLAELDDLGALHSPAGRRAMDWLASVQRADGSWEEDAALAAEAPPWALPGDPEARLYLTTVVGFRLTAAAEDVRQPYDDPGEGRYAAELKAAAGHVAGRLLPDGSWPSFLAAGWHAAVLLHGQQMYYESARVQFVLGDRLPGMSAADVASLAAALRRVGVGSDDWLWQAARKRLGQTQRTDGGWDSDDGPAFDVHTTLTAIRACR